MPQYVRRKVFMRYLRDSDIVTVTDAELSSYAQKKANLPFNAQSGGFEMLMQEDISAEAEVLDASCVFTSSASGRAVTVYTYPDSVSDIDGILTVQLSTSVKNVYRRFNIAYNADFLARGVICARGAAERYGHDSVRLILTTVSRDTGESVSFYRFYTKEAAEKMTDALLLRAAVFIEIFVQRNSTRIDEIKKLSFPYECIREGQHDLMLSVMKTLRRGGRLLASAPTGTGKTMATLYPAVKALGEGYIDRIFYLTGKTVTGKAAFDSMKLLSKGAPSLRCIMIHSKERSCAEKSNKDGCFLCPRMGDAELFGEQTSYKARRDAALSELLSDNTMYTAGIISSVAEKYRLCPYELSLDLSEFCDTVICDYNYVFDTSVRFRRYFVDERDEKYSFLIDECHNLPDRVRAVYSGSVDSSIVSSLSDLSSDGVNADSELSRAISEFSEALRGVKHDCLENARVFTDKTGDHTVGFSKSEAAPPSLIRTSAVLAKLCRARSKEDSDSSDIFKAIADRLSGISLAASAQGEGFAYLAELFDDTVKASLVCLDPSSVIRRMTECAHATVMFSATLNPTEYFADMLGCSDAPVVKAESPFDKNNLSVTVFDGVSTKLSDRKNTARDIAEIIATVLESKEGHYFIFFPSYAYMKTVCRELLDICPDIKAVMQKQSMSYDDREKFLAAFRSDKFKSIAGLCVLGGVFSEGVDLAGDGLIGVIVVGAGLPGISSELNLMSEYYEEKYGRGHLYAYEYPAISRIEQAAGRVIRTDTDRGVIVLIDDRLSSPEMADRFPDFWPQISCTSDTDTLAVILQRFWDSFDE